MGLFKKGQKMYSITSFQCPRCHDSDMFYTKTFSFERPFDMKDRCEVCDLNYSPEPGYYYGAMFVGYIFTAWFSILLVLFLHWVLKWSTGASFAVLIAIMIIFYVAFFRLARAAYININVSYKPDAAKK